MFHHGQRSRQYLHVILETFAIQIKAVPGKERNCNCSGHASCHLEQALCSHGAPRVPTVATFLTPAKKNVMLPFELEEPERERYQQRRQWKFGLFSCFTDGATCAFLNILIPLRVAAAFCWLLALPECATS
jgi:hypothetical protein